MSNDVRMDEMRYDAFYEVWYITVNHKKSGRSFWLRSTLLKTDPSDSQRFGGLWFAMFDKNDESKTFAHHRYYARDEVSFSPGCFDVGIGDSRFREGRYQARFDAEGHTMKWDLAYKPNEQAIGLIPPLLYKTKIPKADLSVPNVDIALYGTIEVDGERFEFDGEPAAECHHWGKHYAKSWLWTHCNDFDERPNAWFEALSVKLLGGRFSPPVTMLKVHTGEETLGVFGVLQLLGANADYRENRWRYLWQTASTRIEAEIIAPKERFVIADYISPHAEAYFCHNTCLADMNLRIYHRKGLGWQVADSLQSRFHAHAEFCTPEQTNPDAFRFSSPKRLKFLNE